jgi:hypothetical protein
MRVAKVETEETEGRLGRTVHDRSELTLCDTNTWLLSKLGIKTDTMTLPVMAKPRKSCMLTMWDPAESTIVRVALAASNKVAMSEGKSSLS